MQFIKPEEVYQTSYDTEIQNKTDRELAIRIAPSSEHKTLQDSFGKMSITVLQIYEEESKISLSREKLEVMLVKEYAEAAPYTGEYHAGKADLLNELLGNDPIKWLEHPNYARLHRYIHSPEGE